MTWRAVSLVLRTERTVVDSSAPYALRLEQIYRPAIDLTPALAAFEPGDPGPLPLRGEPLPLSPCPERERAGCRARFGSGQPAP